MQFAIFKQAARRRYFRWGVLPIISLMLFVGPLKGLTINLVQAPAGTTLTPIYDPGLVQLTAMMQAAANYWEGIILNNHQVTVTYGYADLGPATHGIAQVTAHDGVRATAGNVALAIENNMFGDWYFDPTPTNHSEFAMHQVLYRDLAPVAQNLYYNGLPRDVLEVGYWGNYVGANQGRDALTTTIHELGHILGLSQSLPNFGPQIADGDYDFNPLFTQLDATAVHYHGPGVGDRDHVRSSDSLMAVGAGNGDRNLPSATDLFALASVSNWTLIDLPRKDFWGGGLTNWNTSFNWPGNRLPDAQDIVHVRNGATANLTSANGQAGHLFVQEGSVVSTGANTLNVSGKLTIEGVLPGQQANVVVNSNGRVTAGEIELNQGGLLTLTSGVTEEVEASIVDINPGGVLLGNGDVRINALLTNDGTISAIAGLAGDELSLLAGPVDLDGVSENGRVFATLGNLRISANLTDAFDGEMTIGAGRRVQKFGSWQFGSGSELQFQGGAVSVDSAVLEQAISSVTFAGGLIEVSGWSQINGTKVFINGSTMDIESGGHLVLNGVTTFEGGTYQGPGQGALRLNGPTTVNAATVMNLGVVDLDGVNGVAVTTINSQLTLNVDRLDEFDNRFDGTLNINATLSGLTVNLNDPMDSWEMAGVLNTTGGFVVAQTTLRGSPVRVTGTMNTDGIAQFFAPVDLSGTLTTADAATDVRLSFGPHIIRDTAIVSGPGTLAVNSNGTLLVADGATIGVDTINRGRLEPGTSTGTAAIDGDFSQTATGVLGIEIAGAPGTNQDRLNVAGIAELAGELEVSVFADNPPTIGPTYTILTADSIVGTFDTFNLLANDIFTYQTIVGYPATRVTLRFTDVSMFGDFNNDLTLDCADVDALVSEIATGGMGIQFDLNGDSLVDMADLNLWLQEAGTFNVGGPYLSGDANLDGIVDGLDFLEWNSNKFTNVAAWCSGDFNADGVVDGLDFLDWNANKFMSSDEVVQVPEPTGLAYLLAVLGILIGATRTSKRMK